jgi:hypothetical protein
MKAKKYREYLEMRKKWWDTRDRNYQAAHKRPGSVKVR